MCLKQLKGNSRKYIYATGTACGEPLIISGAVIKANGIPKRWDRMYHVIYARHVLRPNKGYITEFNCELYTGKQSNFNQQQNASSSNEKNESSETSTTSGNAQTNGMPQLKNLKWKDGNNNEIDTAHIGDKVKLTAEVTDIDDGTNCIFNILEKDDDGNNDDVITISVPVKEGKIEVEWEVIYMEDDDDSDSEQEKEEKGYTLPEFIFNAESKKHGVKSESDSGELKVCDWLELEFNDEENNELMKNFEFILILPDGSEKSYTTNDNGYVKITNILKIGDYKIKAENKIVSLK